MKTPFDDWLAQLRRASKGPVPIAIDRGLPYQWAFAMLGDWTGSSIAASLRLAPDAGATLTDFAVAGPTYDADADFTLFTLMLSKVQTAALPADGDGDGLVSIAFDVLFTPAGSIQQRLFGGVATIAGKVTNAA